MDILEQSYAYGSSPLPLIASEPAYVCLFGSHISGSLSPSLHSVMFESGPVPIPWTYRRCETTEGRQFLERLGDERCMGTSITMPNKVTFRGLLDELTEEARVIGAVNTSFVRLDPQKRRKHVGTNTDCIGIREAILHRFPQAVDETRGRPAMVIGSGGAARSAVYALWRWFAPSEIYVVNRLRSEVEELVESFRSSAPEIRLVHLATPAEAESRHAPRLVVGTVPDYPPQDPDEVLCRQVYETVLRKADKGILVDMCYLPSPLTSLYTSAEENGFRVISGTEVLVRVCIVQQILWLERDVSEQTAQRALQAIPMPSRP